MSEVITLTHLQRTGSNALRELLASGFGVAENWHGTVDSIGGFVQRSEAARISAASFTSVSAALMFPPSIDEAKWFE